MSREEKKTAGASAVAGESWLPPVGHPVWVWCTGYRTMATLDAKGIWRSLADGKELKGVVRAIRPR
jgi:hypothetical protein